jgi:hypothetical protein
MKLKNYMHAVGITLILMAIGVCGYAQATLRTGLGIPAYQNTGNAAADAARYENDKSAWIKAHPAEYQAYLKSINKSEATSPSTEAYVNSPWKSQAEKDRMLASNDKDYKAEVSKMPSTKVKIDKRDFDRLDAKTKEMILANPSHYEVIVNLNPTN